MPGTEKHSLELIDDSVVILCSFVSDYRHARLVENFLKEKNDALLLTFIKLRQHLL